MSKHQVLVIVESPTKAKTVGRMLGKNYDVLASFGHVFELVPKNGAVDPDNHFHMNYQPIDKNKKHLDKIVSYAKKAETIVLATDPDREGEAIAWHVCQYLKDKKVLDHLKVMRSTFHQITEKAILAAIENPSEINMSLVDAQQARRAMDFLLGFNISPLMWRTIKPGTSAGRVQSPALNLIVSREHERIAFEKKEYWSIILSTKINKADIPFALCEINDEKLDKFAITNEQQAHEIRDKIQSGKNIGIKDIQAKTRSRNPKAPFTTSTLQQEASNKLGFPTSKTMKIAQELYEGISVGGKQHGLITYMRTDSVNVAKEIIPSIRECINQTYGSDYLPSAENTYKTKTKNAQEAHEAIRPTHLELPPEKIQNELSEDQRKLYQLIWSRTLASQMTAAQINTTTIFLQVDEFLSKASGSVIAHPGFLAAYPEDDKKEPLIPKIKEDDSVSLQEVTPNQHFTEPPPRYTEASLVKALEELGIGRPSTYATIISTLKKRTYVTLEGRQFVPTDIADVVNKFLTLYFKKYIDHHFTAEMEDELDAISRGELDKEGLLTKFWQELDQQIKTIGTEVKRSDVTHEKLEEKCPECSANLVMKLGRHGKFIGCSKYPECGYTRPLNDDQPSSDQPTDKKCPKCSEPIVKKQGPTGGFYGCSGYPNCKHIEPLEENITNTTCPKCTKTKLIKRRSKRGKIFFGCPDFPKCKYATWNPPINKKCPGCKWPIMTEKSLKNGNIIECPECKHKIEDDH